MYLMGVGQEAMDVGGMLTNLNPGVCSPVLMVPLGEQTRDQSWIFSSCSVDLAILLLLWCQNKGVT